MSSMDIIAGSIAGPSNKREEIGNQDSYAFLQENGYTVIAVADGNTELGVNSATGAAIAAATSVEEALDSLITGNDVDDALHRGVESAREVLLSRDDWETLGCTLSLAVVKNDTWGVALVGDAFAVISQEVDDHTLIHRKQENNHIEQNTPSLLTHEDYEPVYIYGENNIVAISLASDGLANIAVENDYKESVYGFWVPIIQKSVSEDLDIQAFLTYLDADGKIEDDTTLVIAVKS